MRFPGRLYRAILAAAFLAPLFLAPARAADTPLTPEEADRRLGVAQRLVDAGVYGRAMELASSILDDPAAQAQSDDFQADLPWLRRREAARFILNRGNFGVAASREAFLAVAGEMVQLANNRYRLPEPAHAVQAAYWAGRAYEEAGEYREAVDNYSRAGGLTLPQEMEGDAARRMSRCLRLLAEEIPFPGNARDRQRRDRLLGQAIAELDRARLSFPVGTRRKEIELDLIALRLARRDEQFVREAATEAETFIERDPAKDELHARAVLYRGQAAAILGRADEAATWFRRVLADEAPAEDDRRAAGVGLALALLELSDASGGRERRDSLNEAARALGEAVRGTMSPGPWDGARVVSARILVELERHGAALDILAPILSGDRVNHAAWRLAGVAELRRGRLGEALRFLYPPTRPSNADTAVRIEAGVDAAGAADARRDHGLALALNHRASRLLRRERLFSSLLMSEFRAMELNVKLGRSGGPVSLSSDLDLLTAESPASTASGSDRRDAALDALSGALGAVLADGGDPDSGYDLAVAAEAADQWSAAGAGKLELGIAMISHLLRRQPAGITDGVLHSHMGVARHALALSRAEAVLGADEPSEADIDRTLGDFAAAAANFQEASAGGQSIQDSLDQGMVNLESGAFLMRMSRKWNRGAWSAMAMRWRDEARLRVEASLRPFNQAVSTSGPGSLAARRARWSRGRALELMEEWRAASVDYLSLMNNSELPRVLRANAARRWAVCLREMGESRQALTRLAIFADADAEAALLAGKLAEETGNARDAYARYLFAADPAAPAIPPATPGRVQEAAYLAAQLALADPNAANPLLPPETVRDNARILLERNALADPGGEWAIPMLNLLGKSHLDQGGAGWRRAYRMARSALERAPDEPELGRAMHLLAARAMLAGGDYPQALDELDQARELLDGGETARRDAALVTLETARVYRLQGRADDAIRAYADVFAVYPDVSEAAEAAREEAARLILSSPDVDEYGVERARNILNGLRDQVMAERIMREYDAN